MESNNMKINKLAAVIRKIVQEEVQREVKKLITEKVEVSSGKLTLQEALSQTETEEYPTAQAFSAADARAGFTSMQGGHASSPSTFEGHSGRVVSADQIDPSITKALTRDYSKLVQKFKK
jgi:5'-deoxynucleotidase YfbR-like HD superfamily hydrolase|tara:strand:+ start:7376 stop:7735 length:360 start_codon:yes stop_codon:yes gene_type:complete